MTETLPPQTHIGTVSLSVADLARSLTFYTDVLGLRVQDRAPEGATLGVDDTPLLVLSEKSGARHAHARPGCTILPCWSPPRGPGPRPGAHRRDADAGPGLRRSPRQRGDLPAGPRWARHLDLRDRPRATWRRENGQIVMATDPLDLDGDLLAELKRARACRGMPTRWLPARRSGTSRCTSTSSTPPGASTRTPSAWDTDGGHALGAVGVGGRLPPSPGPQTGPGWARRPGPPTKHHLEWYAMDLPDEAARDAALAHIPTAGQGPTANGQGLRLEDPTAGRWILRVAA